MVPKELFDIAEKACRRDCPLRQSSIKCGLSCQRKYMFVHRWGLRRKYMDQSPAAQLGTLVHKFMECGPMGIEGAKAWVREQQNVLVKQVENGEDLDGSIAHRIQDFTDAYHKAEAVAQAYWTKYPVPDFIEKVADEQQVEESIAIAGVIVKFQGRIDKVIRDTRSGKLWIRDLKTSGRNLKMVGVGYQWSIQLRLYRLLAEAHLEEPIEGFVVDKLKMPTIKYCRKDKSFDDYVERVKQWYKTLEEEGGEEWARSEAVVFNEPAITPELEDAIIRTVALNDMYPEPTSYARDITGSACCAFERLCPYYELCDTHFKAWPGLIDSEYEFEEPEPETEREEE